MVNITLAEKRGDCDNKCAYNFKYADSALPVTNDTNFISAQYDNLSGAPVTYNNQAYKVQAVRLYAPSQHFFDGEQMPGELIIEHVPVDSIANALFVAVPLVESSYRSANSGLLAEFIQGVANKANNPGSSAQLTIRGFNLSYLVPRRPFYSYTDTDNIDWIVFNRDNGIPLLGTDLKTLSTVISPSSPDMLAEPVEGLFFNSGGPNQTKEDDIYISCQPVNETDDKVAVEYRRSNVNQLDFNKVLSNPTLAFLIKLLLSCVVFILIFAALSYVFNTATGGGKSSASWFKLPNLFSKPDTAAATTPPP